MQALDLSQAPQLTHVDCSNNVVLTNLVVQSNNLQELNCSGNPITSLSLTYSPANLTSFDCAGIKFSTVPPPTPTVTTTSVVTETVMTHLPSNASSVNNLERGLGAGFGLTTCLAIG